MQGLYSRLQMLGLWDGSDVDVIDLVETLALGAPPHAGIALGEALNPL